MADFAPSYSSFVKGLKCLSFPTFLPLCASCLRASKAKIKQGEANGSTIWSLKRERERERSWGGWFPVDFNRLFYSTGATLSAAHRQRLAGSLNMPTRVPVGEESQDSASLWTMQWWTKWGYLLPAMPWVERLKRAIATCSSEGGTQTPQHASRGTNNNVWHGRLVQRFMCDDLVFTRAGQNWTAHLDFFHFGDRCFGLPQVDRHRGNTFCLWNMEIQSECFQSAKANLAA